MIKNEVNYKVHESDAINNEEFDKIISANLHTYNRNKCEWIRKNTEEKPSKINYHNFGVYDCGKLIGGAIGIIQFGWYFLEELWIDENYRGNDIGTELIKNIEKCAINNNAIGVRMETWNFQAKGFYEKMGYKVYATFEDCPPGTVDYFLKKKF